MLPTAVIPLLLTILLGVLGGREHVEILTGTQPQTGLEIVHGFFYILSYFALTLFSPVFVIAAGLIALLDRHRMAHS